MNIPFYKMSGSGNDFIIVDNRENIMQGIDLDNFIKKTCARSVSIGADGLFLIENSDEADFKWQFFNSDGSVAEMCGNGSRCAARFAYLNKIAGEKMSFMTLAGKIHAEIKDGVNVKVQLTKPLDVREDYEIDINGEKVQVCSADTGVPHVCILSDDIENVDLPKIGAAVRYHEEYAPKGTNVNWYGLNDEGALRIRTYERGVEGETLACGTGSVACAIFAVKKSITESPVLIKTSSGIYLKVYLENGDVYLEGEARVVYKGELTEESYNY